MTDSKPPPDRWGVVTQDRGLCLVLDFTHRPSFSGYFIAPTHDLLNDQWIRDRAADFDLPDVVWRDNVFSTHQKALEALPDIAVALEYAHLGISPYKASHAVLRLCDRTLVTHAEDKVRKLMTWEAPSCKVCRTILQRMLEDGQR